MFQRILTPGLKALFLALPKTELHVHLTGAYPVGLIRKLLRESGISEKEIAKATSIQDLYDDLTDFVKYYISVAKLVKSEAHIEQAAYACCIKAAEDNVRYLELKLASAELDPDKIQDKTQRIAKKNSMFEAIKQGVSRARIDLMEEGFKQTVKYMYTAERHEPSEISLEDAKLAVKWSQNPENDFVGFDLAGDEKNFSIEQHKEAIDYARDNGLKITCHAGETKSSESLSNVEAMKKAIEYGATRIGHGLAACDDPELIELMKSKNITIESSPTSNIATMSIEEWKHHPIKNMIKNGITVSLCSDDPAMFNTKISKEYANLYEYGLIDSWEEIKSLVLAGVESSFTEKEEKDELIKDFREEIQRIEANPYFQDVIKKHLKG